MITDEYFSTSKKVKLYIRYWLPECPKAFMMFIHGAGEHSGQYSHLGMECLQRQIAFIAPDVRGFGNSIGPRGHIRRFQDYLDDLDQLVVHLHARNPELPVFLMGHSFGGLIAIRYAQQFCKKIHGIILTSPALDIAPGIPKLIRKMIGLVSFVTPALPLELVKWNESLRKFKWFQSKSPYRTADLLNDPLATIKYTPRWVSELIHNGTRALSEINPFQTPTLCFYDRYDPLVSPDLIERFIGNIVSHDKKLTVYADGKHQFLHNREVLQHIFQWLSVRLE
ncbi:alpha/beta hydrolase [Cohnella laeviribosi]|uniref:alpha/beta hydrolase n=1 Tax=Cohnella laeviribosi TaxID=380174 RepID=UPI00036BA61C|nr:alpha/beta hydrolase [Cohnella laeviribosi]